MKISKNKYPTTLYVLDCYQDARKSVEVIEECIEALRVPVLTPNQVEHLSRLADYHARNIRQCDRHADVAVQNAVLNALTPPDLSDCEVSS